MEKTHPSEQHDASPVRPAQDDPRTPLTAVKGTVFNIQRYSLHDGPGIRTVVFLKGCPLNCKWCCNPESIEPTPHITFNASKCLGDGRCVQACPTGARSGEGYRTELCTFCGRCVDACPSGALELLGKEVTVSELLREVEKDRMFYESSGGGATLSGGEVLVQRRFAVVLLRELRRRYLHTAIETSGFAPWAHVEEIVDECDLVLYDLKHMDSELHRKYVGVPNERILENAAKIAAKKKEIILRVPLIGGVNSDRGNIEAVARFAVEAGVREIHLLPYHRLGESKYAKLGRLNDFRATTPDDGEVRALCSLIEEFDLSVKVGG